MPVSTCSECASSYRPLPSDPINVCSDVEPAWVEQVRAFMLGLNYTQCCTTETLEHIRLHGSVECCESIEPEDRAAIEALVPEAPPSHWHEAMRVRDSDQPACWVWEINDPDACLGSDCGCRRCVAEARELERIGAAVLAGEVATL